MSTQTLSVIEFRLSSGADYFHASPILGRYRSTLSVLGDMRFQVIVEARFEPGRWSMFAPRIVERMFTFDKMGLISMVDVNLRIRALETALNPLMFIEETWES